MDAGEDPSRAATLAALWGGSLSEVLRTWNDGEGYERCGVDSTFPGLADVLYRLTKEYANGEHAQDQPEAGRRVLQNKVRGT